MLLEGVGETLGLAHVPSVRFSNDKIAFVVGGAKRAERRLVDIEGRGRVIFNSFARPVAVVPD
ncbi:hypothetical protein [Paenarthrobacter sp. TA1.8]|uniref:hypothetical protein n=1 Tax=Paenarthrobacter sp. TA1.8 TaxID=3400219 RepID=UPI003B43A864